MVVVVVIVIKTAADTKNSNNDRSSRNSSRTFYNIIAKGKQWRRPTQEFPIEGAYPAFHVLVPSARSDACVVSVGL